MRLRRLELARYGHFEDQALDFGERTGDSDVAVVYGPNEAGKSTAFAAWLDLLYGFPLRSPPYAFLFDRKDLLVGAEIEAGGASLHMWRTAKRTGSLVDADGREVSEHKLSNLLHGLDREAYRTRFSLNDEVLRAGGEEIAAAKGDLGRLLHAGTSGLSGLSQTLDEAQGEVDAFYRRGGSAQTVPLTKRRLRELAAEIRDRRLAPARYDDLRRAAEERHRTAEEARAALSEARRALAHAEAAERRRALIARRERIKADCATYPDGPDLPPGAVAEVVRLATEEREALMREEQAETERGNAAARIDELVPDPQGLELGGVVEMIEALTLDDQPLLMRVVGADADLERRRERRDALLKEARTLGEKTAGGAVDPADAVLETASLDRLDGRLQDLERAEADLRGLEEALAEAREGHGDAPAETKGQEALTEALDMMVSEAPDLEELSEDLAEAEVAARRAAEGLPDGWRDRLRATGGVPPEEEVAAVVAMLERATTIMTDATKRLEEARSARETAGACLQASEENPAAVELPDVQRQRVTREEAWTRHRAALDPETADSFEAAMRADDVATAAYAEGADARALLQSRRDEVAKARAAEEVAARTMAQAEERVAQAAEVLQATAERLLLAAGASHPAVSARRRSLAAALEAAQSADAACDVLARGNRRHEELACALGRALESSGGMVKGVSLVTAARRHLEALHDMAKSRERWQERERHVGQLAGRVERAKARRYSSRRELQELAAGSWAADLAPDALRIALPVARELSQRVKELRDVDHRIARMEDALQTFDRAAERLREILGSHNSSAELMQAARKRHSVAEKLAQDITAETERHRKADEAINSARRARSEAANRLRALLLGQAPRSDEDPSVFVQRLAERDGLRAELKRVEGEIVEIASDLDPELLAKEEAQVDPARPAELRDAVRLAERNSEEAERGFGAAQQELRGALDAGGAATADQERAAILEELHAGARETAARMIGLAAARSALRRLGETRRGSMLRDTETAFRRLTGNTWTRLDTWVEGRDERLVGVTSGRAVPADGMSTGTRAQLYLALRIAGHAAFVREAGPLPFVTDDILESFDDDRAAAALDLTAELGRRGQAILFTHHAHLVDLARTRIGGVKVVEMPPRVSPAA